MTEHDLELRVAWQRHVRADDRLLDALAARHREPHRHYHNASHVTWVIRRVEELASAEAATNLDEVVAAAFYHDAIYAPTGCGNERASADLARRELTTARWSGDRIDRVAAMIEATEHTAAVADDHDTAILLDADLAVLGADPAAYATYARGVRLEYHHLDDATWTSGRAAVLRSFLDRQRIYRTAVGRTRWEQRARANLTAELASLG